MQRKSIDHEDNGKQNNNKNPPKIRPLSIAYFTYGNLTGLKVNENKIVLFTHHVVFQTAWNKNSKAINTACLYCTCH
jgi:hypothetical protein